MSLTLTKLHSGYSEQEILHGIDIIVNLGEIVAIIGPNGSGKSTALKSIFSQTKILSGKILFNEVDITDLQTHKLILEGISYVPQGRQVFPDLTVKENLEMGAFTVKDKKIINQRIKKVFSQFNMLKEKQDEYAFALSGGQQQILAIARALMQEPKLILLDEPSLGLSPKATDEIFKIIKELNNQGISMLIVEQNAKKAVEIATSTYVLEDGKIALHGGKEILNNKKIKDIYFGGR